MNIVIIEDERLVADDLETNLKQLLFDKVNVVQLRSVKESIAYLNATPAPDLIFSDIQLGDGLSFEVFASINKPLPVIFCTAYDEYALDAFKANGIDYILKPFTLQMLEQALNKYSQLKQVFLANQSFQYNTLMQMLNERIIQKTSSIIVYHQDKIIPISVDDIALFYLEGELTHLLTYAGKTYYPNKSLEELERIAGSNFFRTNRQFLVSRRSIIDVSSFFSRKLSLNLCLPFKEKIIVSKAKASVFLEWLANTG
jgi:DNA-binding LytR/AlgR family response regulator